MSARRTGAVERLSSGDLMQLAFDVGPVPMHVGAVLVLDAGPGVELAAARDAFADRIAAIPRLRQRLLRVPLGCGRPIWVDDTTFDLRRPSAPRRASHRATSTPSWRPPWRLLTAPRPPDRPPWSAT